MALICDPEAEYHARRRICTWISNDKTIKHQTLPQTRRACHYMFERIGFSLLGLAAADLQVPVLGQHRTL